MNSLDLPVIAFFHLDNTIHLLFGACCFLKPAIYTCVFRIVVHFSELTLVHQPTNVSSWKTQHNAENASVNEPLLQSNWKGKLHCSFVFNVLHNVMILNCLCILLNIKIIFFLLCHWCFFGQAGCFLFLFTCIKFQSLVSVKFFKGLFYFLD